MGNYAATRAIPSLEGSKGGCANKQTAVDYRTLPVDAGGSKARPSLLQRSAWKPMPQPNSGGLTFAPTDCMPPAHARDVYRRGRPLWRS